MALLAMTVPANAVQSGVLIQAIVHGIGFPYSGSRWTANIKTGSPTNEVTRYSQIFVTDSATNVDVATQPQVEMVMCLDKAADYTEDVSIKVTANTTTLHNNTYLSGCQLLVFGV